MSYGIFTVLVLVCTDDLDRVANEGPLIPLAIEERRSWLHDVE